MDFDDLLFNHYLKDFEVIKVINDGLFFAVIHYPTNKYIIKSELDRTFSGVDLTKSFRNKIVIAFQETLFPEVLLELHNWLSEQCCNIENIIVVVTQTLGVADWYKKYLELFGFVGFKLIDVPWFTNMFAERINSIQPYNDMHSNKRLEYYFSFYGGTHGTVERDFLTAQLSDLNIGYVDYMSGFHSSDQAFEGYLEHQTRFVDRFTVDKLINARQSAKFEQSEQKEFNEDFSNKGFQYQIDKVSACHVIRETMNYGPYPMVSEKTLRSFLHQQIPIPLGPNTVEYLSKLGFCMDYNIINYDYQYTINFYDRIVKICHELTMLKNTHSLDDLNNYLHDNKEMIKYNYNYIQSGELFKKIGQNLVEKINE